jgi:putative membrane protein
MKQRNQKILATGVFVFAFAFTSVSCQRNPQNVQAAREDTVPGATNQNPSRAANSGKDALLSQADQTFMKNAEDGSIRERNLARVAMQRTQNSDVRDYAKMVADDHTKDLHNIVNLMESKGIPQPKNMPEVKHQAEGMLDSLNGPAMDRAFIETMIKDHQKDVEEFTKEERSGEDPAVRDYAAHELETLQKHLQKAQELQSKLMESPSK